MTIKQFSNDFRLALIGFALAVAQSLAQLIDTVRDWFNGDVDTVLAGFARLDTRLDRARMKAIREANQLDTYIDVLEAQIEEAEANYDAKIRAAERAAKAQKRLEALTK